MHRGSNPFDVFAEDPHAGSRNNPFLHDIGPEMGLSLRLARLKEDMREYEKRMSQVWMPPGNRLSVDWDHRRRVMREEGPRIPPANVTEEPYDPSELQYRDRLAFMRSSLVSKRQEIESALSVPTPLRPAPVPLSNPPSKTSTLSHVSIPSNSTPKAAEDLKDREIAALRMEQTQLREELSQLKVRLEQLESRSSAQQFEETEDWAQPRLRPSFGRKALSRASITSLPKD